MVIGISPAVMATRSTDSAAAGRGVAKTRAKIALSNRLDVKRPGKIMSTSNEICREVACNLNTKFRHPGSWR